MQCGFCGLVHNGQEAFCTKCGQQLCNHEESQHQINSMDSLKLDNKSVENYGFRLKLLDRFSKKQKVAAVVCFAILICLILWYCSYTDNVLAGTRWIDYEGDIIVFTDEEHGYYTSVSVEGESFECIEGNEFQYYIDEDWLTLVRKDFTVTYAFKIQNNQLVLMGDKNDKDVYMKRNVAFECEYCREYKLQGHSSGGKRYCDNCWKYVSGYRW